MTVSTRESGVSARSRSMYKHTNLLASDNLASPAKDLGTYSGASLHRRSFHSVGIGISEFGKTSSKCPLGQNCHRLCISHPIAGMAARSLRQSDDEADHERRNNRRCKRAA